MRDSTTDCCVTPALHFLAVILLQALRALQMLAMKSDNDELYNKCHRVLHTYCYVHVSVIA